MSILLRFMGFVKKYWGQLTFSAICLLITTVASLVIPKVLGVGIDSLESGEKSALFVAGALIIGSSIVRGLSAYGNRYLNQVISQEVSYDIRNAIYDHLQKLSFAYHDQAQTGNLMSRATADIEAVRMWVGEGLLTLFQTVFQIIGISIILILVDWRLALLCLAFMPAIAWIAISTSNRLRPVWLHVQQLMGFLGTTLQESLAGVRVVKAFSRQKEEGLKFGADAKKLYDEQVSAARVQAVNQALMSMLLGLPTVIVLWYGGKQVVEATLTIGEVAQFILYLGMLAMPIRRLGMIANMFSRSISAGERIFEILDTKSPVQEKPWAKDIGRLTGQVTFENVSFSYNSSAPAIDNISFSARPGQLVALLEIGRAHV